MASVVAKSELELRAIGIYTTGEDITVEKLETMTKDEKIEYIDEHIIEDLEGHDPLSIFIRAEMDCDEQEAYLRGLDITVVDTLAETSSENDKQILAVKCAIADLQGTIDCMEYADVIDHKKDCAETIDDLQRAFKIN